MYSGYVIMGQTESYKLLFPWEEGTAIIIREADEYYCYASDLDARKLHDLINTKHFNEFTIICNSFQYIDPMQERAIC